MTAAAIRIPSVPDVERLAMLLGLGLMAGVAVYVLAKGIKGATRDIVGSAGGVVDDAVSGTVEGLGDIFGIPSTDPTKCRVAKAKGAAYEASKYCTAAEYIDWLWGGRKQGGATGTW